MASHKISVSNTFLSVVFLVFVMSSVCLGQNEQFAEISQIPTEEQITNKDWKERQKAFALLIGANVESYIRYGLQSVRNVLINTLEEQPQTAELRALRLIRLLQVENDVLAQKENLRIQRGLQELPKEERFTEEYTNYYADVIAAVTSLGDLRSMNALLGAISTGGMVARALISFGQPAVQPLVDIVENSDHVIDRYSAIRILGNMLIDSTEVVSDPIYRAIIKETLIRAASDEAFIMRINAVVGLVRIGDEESIKLVELIAETDPYKAEFAEDRFVVREAAREALTEYTSN